ncbi:MAG TPA: iron-sulfur cluster repair di-iron protein, ric [Thermoanaerobacterales bacterium]|nr:iron-sulfur cluster repair di-iron protein, ric [Thermoanaerobacterales bacterium]
MSTFKEAKEKNLKKLEQFVPIVARVHGKAHPEFYDVHKLFDAICAKIKEAGSETPDLNQEFEQLRQITGNYTVPEGVCETYEAVYNMLEELDKAYQKQQEKD